MNMKEAMLKYAPELAKDYREFILRQFKAMQDDLGPGLAGVYSSHKWGRVFSGLRRNIKKDHPEGRPSHVLSSRDYDAVPYVISEEALAQNAEKYGEEVALTWYNKMQSKVGGLSNVSVTDPASGWVILTGNHGKDKVQVRQQRIINVSSRGTPFHQFPALIYVNDKFLSEAAYKKLTLGWGFKPAPEKPVTMYACGKCGYTGRMGDFKSGAGMLSCPKCRSLNIRKVPGTQPKEHYVATTTGRASSRTPSRSAPPSSIGRIR